jgi:hypothetical protein
VAERSPTFGFVWPDSDDPFDAARAAIAGIFLFAGVIGLVGFAATRSALALTLAGAAWTLWGIFSGLLNRVVEPATSILANLLTGGSVGMGGTDSPLTAADEAAMLERLLEQSRPAHDQILTGIRLAEIYRTHDHDPAKADALIARLCERYPDARELRFVRGA